MKSVSVSLIFGVSVHLLSALSVSAVSLNISPNLQQFFVGDSSVSLSCVEDGQTADGWTVKTTNEGQPVDCGAAGLYSRRVDGSSCVLDLITSFTASYWCETSSGQSSETITINVRAKNLILEIPALPVQTGNDVTLLCRHRVHGPVKVYFFINESCVETGAKQEHIIQNVQLSDQGFYWCYTDIYGESSQSFLRVREPSLLPIVKSSTPSVSSDPDPPPSSSSSSPPLSVVHLFCHLLVICPYCICSILLVSICCSRNSGNQTAISMETSQPVQDDDDISADVTTELCF